MKKTTIFLCIVGHTFLASCATHPAKTDKFTIFSFLLSFFTQKDLHDWNEYRSVSKGWKKEAHAWLTEYLKERPKHVQGWLQHYCFRHKKELQNCFIHYSLTNPNKIRLSFEQYLRISGEYALFKVVRALCADAERAGEEAVGAQEIQFIDKGKTKLVDPFYDTNHTEKGIALVIKNHFPFALYTPWGELRLFTKIQHQKKNGRRLFSARLIEPLSLVLHSFSASPSPFTNCISTYYMPLDVWKKGDEGLYQLKYRIVESEALYKKFCHQPVIMYTHKSPHCSVFAIKKFHGQHLPSLHLNYEEQGSTSKKSTRYHYHHITWRILQKMYQKELAQNAIAL